MIDPAYNDLAIGEAFEDLRPLYLNLQRHVAALAVRIAVYEGEPFCNIPDAEQAIWAHLKKKYDPKPKRKTADQPAAVLHSVAELARKTTDQFFNRAN